MPEERKKFFKEIRLLREDQKCQWIAGKITKRGETPKCERRTIKRSSWCKKHYEIVFTTDQSHAKALIEIQAERLGYAKAKS